MQSLGPIWWEVRTNSCKLSYDLHMHIVANTCAHMHIHKIHVKNLRKLCYLEIVPKVELENMNQLWNMLSEWSQIQKDKWGRIPSRDQLMGTYIGKLSSKQYLIFIYFKLLKQYTAWKTLFYKRNTEWVWWISVSGERWGRKGESNSGNISTHMIKIILRIFPMIFFSKQNAQA